MVALVVSHTGLVSLPVPVVGQQNSTLLHVPVVGGAGTGLIGLIVGHARHDTTSMMVRFCHRIVSKQP